MGEYFDDLLFQMRLITSLLMMIFGTMLYWTVVSRRK